MFWFKPKPTGIAADAEIVIRQVKKFQLVQRAKNATSDLIDYEQRLRDFLLNNRNNQELIRAAATRRAYLIGMGCDKQQAARATLEKYQH